MNKSICIKNRNLRQTSVLVAVLLLCGCLRAGLAQESKINLNTLLNETQKMSEKADEMTLVWWIPKEYWQLSLEEDPTVTKLQIKKIIEVLRPYIIIVIVDGKLGVFGGITYRSEADIRANINIIDHQGARYLPLREERVDADTKNFLSVMKPILANMLGRMGQNMHFFLFPAKDKKSKNIVETKKEGAFSVRLGDREFRWKLPLGSLLPPKICLKCEEECSGAWKFCPWCGTKLPKSGK